MHEIWTMVLFRQPYWELFCAREPFHYPAPITQVPTRTGQGSWCWKVSLETSAARWGEGKVYCAPARVIKLVFSHRRWRWWISVVTSSHSAWSCMPSPALLSCENLTKAFGGPPLFEGLSFALQEGDHLGLVGPNGAG